jgi:DNA-binding XRE family transcriptional regulator
MLIENNMPRPSKIAEHPPAAVQATLARLGQNIRIARLRRRLTQEALARHIGISRFVVADLEKGKPTTGIAAYMGALWVLGLLDDMAAIADPDGDEEGKILERARSPKTARSRRILSDAF